MIASEVQGSVSKNCVELTELPNDGKNNNTYGDEIIYWNECPIDEMGVIEEHENINSIDLLLVNVFLVKKKLSFSIKMMQIDMVLQFEKVVLRKKKLVRCDFFCHRQGKQPLKIMDPSKEQ